MKTEIAELVNLIRRCDEQIKSLTALRELSCLEIELRFGALKHAVGYGQATPIVQQRWDEFTKAHPVLAVTELFEILITCKKSIADFIAVYQGQSDLRSALLKLPSSSPAGAPTTPALN